MDNNSFHLISNSLLSYIYVKYNLFWKYCVHTVLKGNPSPVHARPTFNDDPPDANDDTDGEFYGL